MGVRGLREMRVGAVIIIGLAIMIGFVFFLGGDQSFLGEKIKFNILFENTAGLYEGDPVLLTGVEVGNVSAIGFPEDPAINRILVEVEVDASIRSRIRQDTRARVGSASLVYGKVVTLSMGSQNFPVLEPDSFIPVDESPGYGAIVDSTIMVLNDIRRVLGKVDRGDGALGIMLNEPMKMKETLHNLSEASRHLSSLLEKAEKGEGSIGAFFADSSNVSEALDQFNQVTAGLQIITQNLKGHDSALGKLMNDPVYGETVTKDLQQTLHALANIATKIDSGKGTIGQLINDPGVYYGLQNVVLGIEQSSLTKWMIQNRRKSGEKTQEKIEDIPEE